MAVPILLAAARAASTVSVRAASAAAVRRGVLGSHKAKEALGKQRAKMNRDQRCRALYKLAEGYAKEFRKYLYEFVANNVLQHPAKSPFTKMMQNKRKGNPLVNTRLLITKYLIIEPTANGYKVGFVNNSTYGDTDMTVTDLLNILERGGDVPKNMMAYDRVRAYIWAKMREKYGSAKLREMLKSGKIVSKKRDGEPFKIPPRPFFVQAYQNFTRSRITKGISFTRRGRTMYISVRC